MTRERLNVYPDGGIARLRMHGSPTGRIIYETGAKTFGDTDGAVGFLKLSRGTPVCQFTHHNPGHLAASILTCYVVAA